MTILALDCGRTTGWARSTGSTGTLTLKHIDNGDAFRTWMLWLSDQLSEHRPSLLLLERPFMASRLRDADFTPTLVNIAHAIACTHDIPRREIAALSVRKSVFGRATKLTDRERIAAIRDMGWPVQSDHEADAVALILAWQEKQEMAT